MKYVRYSLPSAPTRPLAGVLTPDETGVLPISELCRDADLFDLIGRDAEIAALSARRSAVPLDQVMLLSPIAQPRRNAFCVGKNYHAHAEEFHRSGFDSSAGKEATPEAPIIFTKAPSSFIGPNEDIPGWLDDSESTDYEGELAVIIGTGGRAIAKEDAMAHVWGYTVTNDVTARTVQREHRQWLLGKSVDGFCPIGPCITPAADMPAIADLRLVTTVNGETRQNACVADLIFDIPTLIETISKRITLEPGDIILTGTPEGVGIGMTPPTYLKKGDVVTVEISGIGKLENVVA